MSNLQNSHKNTYDENFFVVKLKAFHYAKIEFRFRYFSVNFANTEFLEHRFTRRPTDDSFTNNKKKYFVFE